MATSLINRAANVVQELLGGSSSTEQPITNIKSDGRQSCLERYGMIARKEHILRNEWRREDIEYTKQLVASEYLIQSEFKVGPDEESIEAEIEAARTRQEDSAARAAKKAERKRIKREKKEDKKAAKVSGVNNSAQPGGVNTKTEPVEATQDYIPSDTSWMEYANNGYLPTE